MTSLKLVYAINSPIIVVLSCLGCLRLTCLYTDDRRRATTTCDPLWVHDHQQDMLHCDLRICGLSTISVVSAAAAAAGS